MPDKIVIIVTANFKKLNQDAYFTVLLRFLKEYAPKYGFENIWIEGEIDRFDKSKYGFVKYDSYVYIPIRIEDIVIPK